MKKSLIFTLLLLAAGHLSAQLQAVFDYSTFYAAAQDLPYVETHLQFEARTLQFVPQPDGRLKATVEVALVVRQADSVCFFKKYDLGSPVVDPSDNLDFSFLDVQRFALRNGIYDLQLLVRDKATSTDPVEVNEKLVVYYDNRQPRLSSLLMVSQARPTEVENILSRNGYDMEPFVGDFYPRSVGKLNFYYEVYNIATELGRQPFLAIAYIEVKESGTPVDGLRLSARKQAEPTVPVYGSFDISTLPSGNYNLVVELRNADGNTLLYKRQPFFRSNPGVQPKLASDFAVTWAGQYTDPDQLRTYVDALSPIASNLEREVIADLVRSSATTVEQFQAFLYQFWTDRSALTAASDWEKYRARVDYVQEAFSYPKTPGIHTDRGHVYLKYGKPDFVRDEKNYVGTATRSGNVNLSATTQTLAGEADPTSSQSGNGHIYYLPYQLWRYNELPGDDPNRVFLFWDEHRSGYYRLLVSNARGEVQEVGWERRLSRNELPEGTVGEVGLQFDRGY